MTDLRSAVVTGATGLVGSALCRCLTEAGIRVYAVARPGSVRADHVPAEAETVFCALADLARLPSMIPEADAFFHLGWEGAFGPARQDRPLQEDNVRCAVLAAEAAKTLGCRVFVFAGSQAENGRIEGLVRADSPCRPLTAYGEAKLRAGQETRAVCRAAGIRHVRARILSVYGPYDRPSCAIPTLIRCLRAGETPAMTAGEQRWDYLYADDAASALLCMARDGRDGAVYPLGSGEARPLRETFGIVRDLVAPGADLGLGRIPYPPGQVMHLQADLTPLREDTGFVPRISLEEGIRRLAAFMEGEGT